MAKIDFSKGEESINDAIQKMRMKQLREGKAITSQRAVDYFGLDNSPRPLPEDSVERLLEEEAVAPLEEETAENQLENIQGEDQEISQPVDSEEQDEYEEFGEAYETVPAYERLVKFKPRKHEGAQIQKQQSIAPALESPTQERNEEISPLLTLRKHILWLKLQGIDDRYERLGTTKKEIFLLRRKKELSHDDIRRISQLISKAKEIKSALQKEKGHDSDDKLIEKQQKYYKNKYLSVRDRWLKL